jgi:hypothetical protein
MSRIIQVKTPEQLQEFLWLRGALVRREDSWPEPEEVIDIRMWAYPLTTETFPRPQWLPSHPLWG